MDLGLVFFGDSFVAGVRDETALGWAGKLSQRTNAMTDRPVTSYNLGIKGETVVSLSQRLVGELTPRLHPSLSCRVVICSGTNDTLLLNNRIRTEQQDAETALSKAVELAQKIAPVLVCGPPAIPDPVQTERNAALSDRYKAVCKHFDVPFVPLIPGTQNNETWLSECAEDDGFHPRGSGYQTLADYIFETLEWSEFIKSQ